MKLLTKTTLYIATLSMFLFFIMGIIFFHILKRISLTELDRALYEIRKDVEKSFPLILDGTIGHLPGIDSFSLAPADQPLSADGTLMGDTVMFDLESGQYRTYRYMVFPVEYGRTYRVKLYRSTTPADLLVERVTLMMTLMVILFLGGIFLLNRFIFTSLWKDFFQALDRLRRFDKEKEPVVLKEPDIEEFAELNRVLERMTRRLASDYRELKEYTDHTTHELQTPLAVIRTKTELLLQSANLGAEEIQLIQSINRSADHLTRLNSALALITRIENRQFTGTEEIRLSLLLDEHFEMLQELIEMRGISIERDYRDELEVVMDPGLARILVGNLLKNAVIHNRDGGKITLRLGEDGLVICNDGPPLPFDRGELFRRFVRDTRRQGNFGLGLWLVRKICEYYGFRIDYDYREKRHCFLLQFATNPVGQ